MRVTTSRQAHFTLIEILVVITLIVLIMTMFMPSISRIFTGNAVDYGAASFKSYCGMVRAQAAVEKEDISILMVTGIVAGKSKPVDSLDVFSFRAYRAAKLTAREDIAPDVYEVEWVKGSKWNFLPVGAYFNFTADSSKDIDPNLEGGVIRLINSENPGDDTYPQDTTNPTFSARRIVFQGNSRAGGSYEVFVCEGTPVEENNAPTGDRANNDNWVKVVVNSLTGKAKVMER